MQLEVIDNVHAGRKAAKETIEVEEDDSKHG
jgi:hypothetical protein